MSHVDVPPPPPGTWKPAHRAAQRVLGPLGRFLHVEAASGVVLLAAAVVAIVWASSPWAASYEALWHAPVVLGVGALTVTKPIHFWVNDGLMVIFFFSVGLEIRREIHQGELSELRRAALPVAAAIGGMIAPALLFLILNTRPPARDGWGIPMATDIAFAVGVLTLLGKRVPAALRVLLLALAIIDDIGAILVIAVAYSSGLSVDGLLIAAAGVGLVIAFQKLGVRRPVFYVLPALVLWIGLLRSGIHPTIAGVILGLLTPVTRWKEEEEVSPLERLEPRLHPWVAFAIMPIFALANAGVSLRGIRLGEPGALGIASGIVLGLVVGKPVGIVLASAVCVRLGIAKLPRGVRWIGVAVVGAVAGIGFTMAIFVAELAFSGGASLGTAKVAVLVASLTAAVVGLTLGRYALALPAPSEREATVDECETSTVS